MWVLWLYIFSTSFDSISFRYGWHHNAFTKVCFCKCMPSFTCISYYYFKIKTETTTTNNVWEKQIDNAFDSKKNHSHLFVCSIPFSHACICSTYNSYSIRFSLSIVAHATGQLSASMILFSFFLSLPLSLSL